MRAVEAEAILSEDTSAGAIQTAANAAAEAARPIDDLRASAKYRRAMVAVLARRGIEATLAQPEAAR
jgi:carbon-monoxide dehydrogenase medium subunit